MKKAIIFTILILSLVITGCVTKKTTDDRQQTADETKHENTEIQEQAEESKDAPLAETDAVKSVEGTEGWRVYEKEDMDVRLKYHKNWYYQRYNDERSEGYDLFVGFAPDSKMLDYTEPYPIEFVIVSSDNVGDSDSGLLIAERKGKLYKLYTIDKKKYGDILDKMAESFEFLDEADEAADDRPADAEAIAGKQQTTEDWQVYQNEEFGFEFKYPEKEINIIFQDKDRIYLENESGEKLTLSLYLFKDIKEQAEISGPGQHYAKIAYDNWAYILNSEESGDCSQNLKNHISGETVADTYEGKCLITHKNNYVKLDLENEVYYYTPIVEVIFSNVFNGEIFNQILSTFKFIDK